MAPPTTAAPTGGTDEVLRALTDLVSRWTSQEFQREVAAGIDIDLDPTAIRALHTLGREGGTATPSLIAAELHMSRPSTSKLLARLTDAGLAQRAVQANDRRSVAVSLTAQGQTTYEQLYGAGISMVDAATRDWSATDHAALLTLLPRFLTHLTSPSQ